MRAVGVGVLILAATGTAAGAWRVEGERALPAGTSTRQTVGSGQKTDRGFSWEAERRGTTGRGTDWAAAATGEGHRTDDGRQWESTTEGAATKSGSGISWQSQTQGHTEDGKTWQSQRHGNRKKSAGTTGASTTAGGAHKSAKRPASKGSGRKR